MQSIKQQKKKAITGVSFIGEFCQTFRNQHNLNSITAQKKWEKILIHVRLE